MTRLARAILLALAFLAPAASARDLRHPASGQPAFTLTVPDDWTLLTLDGGKSLSISSDDHRIGFALTVDVTRKSTDQILKEALAATKGTLLDTRPATISGIAGRSYAWTYVNAGGFKLRVTMIMIQLEDKWIASCTKLEVDGNTPAQQQLANTVMQSVKLTTEGK